MKPSAQPIDTFNVGVRGFPETPLTRTRSVAISSIRAVVKSTTTRGERIQQVEIHHVGREQRAGRNQHAGHQGDQCGEATLAAYRNLWFHTGDRGYFDQDGYLYLVDRKKDAIRRRGENISSWEVEQIIGRHQAVAEVAVFAVQPLDQGGVTENAGGP